MADQQHQYRHHPLPPGSAAQQQSYPESASIQPHQQQQYPQHQQEQPVSPSQLSAQYSPQEQQFQPIQQPPPAHPPSEGGHPASPSQSRPSTHNRQTSRSRTFSFQSGKSHKSTGSHSKDDTHETHAEKEARRLHSKADPTMAISEAEPAAVQAMTKSSLAPLRLIQHRDSFGNTIVDPDRSNPTRSRWERPLDTIRSFEAAIDGGYSRKSMIRSDSESIANWNRRTSHYGGGNGPRFPQDSYYGGRAGSMMRPDSMHMDHENGNRASYYDPRNGGGYNGGGGGYGYGAGPNRRGPPPRTMTEPPVNGYGRGEQHVYPQPHKDRSYETVTTAAGSGSSADHAGYQTDPTSSDNSSVRRASPPKRQEPVNDYGIGFNQPASFQAPAFNGFAQGARNGGPSDAPPPPPHHAKPPGDMAAPPVPQKGGLLRKQSTVKQADSAAGGDKRKSWFSRRFSKNS